MYWFFHFPSPFLPPSLSPVVWSCSKCHHVHSMSSCYCCWPHDLISLCCSPNAPNSRSSVFRLQGGGHDVHALRDSRRFAGVIRPGERLLKGQRRLPEELQVCFWQTPRFHRLHGEKSFKPSSPAHASDPLGLRLFNVIVRPRCFFLKKKMTSF